MRSNFRFGEQVHSQVQQVARLRGQISRMPQQLHRTVRRRITGDADVHLRDHVRAVMEEPPAIRLRDKVSFLLGVMG